MNAGLPCRSTDDQFFGCLDVDDIDNGTCTGGGSGECNEEANFCGPGATQCTPGFCIDTTPGQFNTDGQPCTSDAQCGAGSCSCPKGRCCVAGEDCAKETFANCETLGGDWFATNDACGIIGQSDVRNICPVYGAGIAPEGTLNTAVGPILSQNPQDCPNTLFSAGDDYDAGGGGYVAVEIVRFIASVQVQTRLTIEFWDTSVAPAILIEDTFFVGSPGAGGPVIRTLVFDPPLTVPASGALALVNADRFTPLGASSFMAVQEAASVGFSDPNEMWLNGAIVSGGVLGECAGGTRDGEWCDLPGALTTCPGGACTDIPDTLAFEIVASVSGDPTGACCSPDDGACSLKLPWVCDDDGGVFQGNSTFCRACIHNAFISCTTDNDCRVCTGDPATEGDNCDDDIDCGAGSCVITGCSPVPPACAVQGCCAGSGLGSIPVCNVFSDNAGFHCPNGDADCDGGGSACSDSVNIAEGNCVSIRGGCSTPDGNGDSIPCSQDADCPTGGDTCLNNACPVGSGFGSGNFGSSCTPSVCVQPLQEDCPDGSCIADVCSGGDRDGLACLKHSGGDNCFHAPVSIVSVPPLTSPPTALTTTITGNNAEATYDDFNEGVCNGGANDGQDCDPNASDEDQLIACPGGTCDSLCGSGIFNPNGVTADPGWWEAFSLPVCANIRIGLCGSSLVVQPAWAFLSTGCPCANFIGNDGVAPPVGTGLGGDGSERGDPFCSLSDNLWQTFRNLPPGRYYYPILSDPDGTCAAPVANPDAGGCTYQLQITAGPCLEAACCSDAQCVGGSDNGLPCDFVGITECPDGDCVKGTCDAGILVGHACTISSVDQCPGGTCTDGPGCTQTTTLRCEAAGGFFAAELNLPENTCAGGPRIGNACVDDLDCPESSCTPVSGVTACPGAGELGVCEFGACCDGPGNCGDTSDPNDPDGQLVVWDRQQCNIETQGSGTFVAGSRCNYPDPPCPVCTAAETPGNCQIDTAGFPWSIDINGTYTIAGVDSDRPQVHAGPVADDFIANVPEIGQFCFSPCFTQRNANGGLIGECSDPQGAVPPPPDQFFVRFFDDGANDANPDTLPGFPGDALPGSPAPGVAVEIAAKRWKGGGFRCWDYSIVFDPPIQGFVQGRRYWVEFSAKGSRDPEGNGCEVFILGSLEGNGWSFYDSDNFGVDVFGDRVWDINDAWLWLEGGHQQDFAFCIEGGLTVPPPMTGACCQCDGTCTEDVAPTDCLRGTDIDHDTDIVTDVNSTIGDYFPLQSCAEIQCLNVGAGGGCPGELGAVAEDCGNPMCIGPAGTMCVDGAPPEASLELFNFTNVTGSNLCSSTDGREQYDNCGGDVVPAGTDHWFEVHGPVSGKLNFDVCGSRLDVVTAVYTNGTPICPNDVDNGGTCPPVGNPVFCADAECAGKFNRPTGSAFGRAACVGGANDTQECNDDIECPDGTCEGPCFLIRVAGYAGDVGTYKLELQYGHSECPPSSPPVPDQVNDEDLTMNRSLAFSAGDAGLGFQAIRVRVDSVTFAHHQYLVGSTWWVQAPEAYGELASTPDPVVGFGNFRASPLGCTPHARDWNGVCNAGECQGGLRNGTCESSVCIGGPDEGSGCGVDADCSGETCTAAVDCGGGIINLYGEMLVPGASYTVSVIGAECDSNDENNFTDASLKMVTSGYGDVAGLCDETGCDVPDGGQTAVADALAILAKFGGYPGAMRKMRADTEPSALDHKINVTDVLQALAAFGGLQYPFLSCRPTASSGLLCFGGPTHLQPCVNDLDCRVAVCPGQEVRSGVASR